MKYNKTKLTDKDFNLIVLAFGLVLVMVFAYFAYMQSQKKPDVGANFHVTNITPTPVILGVDVLNSELLTKTVKDAFTPTPKKGVPGKKPTMTLTPTVSYEIVNNAQGVTNAGDLYLRAYPSIESTIIRPINYQITLEVLGKSDDSKWYLVMTQGEKLNGWVSVDFIDLTNNLNIKNIPFVEKKVFPTMTKTQANWDFNGDGTVTCKDFRSQAQAWAAYRDGAKQLIAPNETVPCSKLPEK